MNTYFHYCCQVTSDAFVGKQLFCKNCAPVQLHYVISVNFNVVPFLRELFRFAVNSKSCTFMPFCKTAWTYNENHGQWKRYKRHCKCFDDSCYHDQCIANWAAVIALQVLIGHWGEVQHVLENAETVNGEDLNRSDNTHLAITMNR